MDNQRPETFLKDNTLFGLFVGLSFIAVTYLYYRSGRSITINPQLNNVLLLLSIAGTFIGVRKYREESQGGYLSYGKALGACIYLTAVAAFCYGICIYVLYHRHAELLETYTGMVESALQEIYGDSPLLENMKTLVKTFTTPVSIAFAEIFNKIITGFIFSLFLAGLLRKYKPNSTL